VLAAVADASAATGLAAAVRGSAGVGVLYAGLPGDAEPQAVQQFVSMVRSAYDGHDGAAVVLRAPAPVHAVVDTWGPVRGLALMHRLKDQFDPEHRMAPGRFVGGI
ncbi:MAG: hypothetical protein WCB04_10890, partial [Mycobacteriales bacterium]